MIEGMICAIERSYYFTLLNHGPPIEITKLIFIFVFLVTAQKALLKRRRKQQRMLPSQLLGNLILMYKQMGRFRRKLVLEQN